MLRVSKLTDYGVLLGTRLAQVAKGPISTVGISPVSVSRLAAGTGIPEPTVAKVMKLLAKRGLVESVRGPQGGYRLALAASEISVLDLITAIEGPVALTECQVDEREIHEGGCEYEGQCDVQGNWQLINQVIRDALKSVTLASMAHENHENRHEMAKIVSIESLRKAHER